MMVMPGNDRGCWWGYLAGKYPGRIGSLVSPGWWKTPVSFAPYAIDNGAYCGFDEKAFTGLLNKAKKHLPPLWLLVPDAVGNKIETKRLWKIWKPVLEPLGWPLAFAVQDGMTPEDVPECDVVFVGGSYDWKWRHLCTWTRHFNRVHVGRVNTERHLWQADNAGAESCDGTGWFRNPTKEIPGLLRYLDGHRNQTPELPFP